MSLHFRLDKVLANIRQADTADLLDRVTVFRDGMESEALDMAEAELARRGIGPDEIHRHNREWKHRVIKKSDGLPARCSFCPRAAIRSQLAWHRLWGVLPLFRRTFFYCEAHWQGRT